MYRTSFCALLLASAFCSSAFGQTTPQFSLVDLGPTTAGSGLPWQAIQATPNTTLPSEASTQGAACFGSTTNLIYAESPGGEIVGSTCLTTPNSDAAMWMFIPGQFPKLTDLSVLPGALGSARTSGPSAAAINYNNEGEIIGVSDTKFPLANSTQQARHAFLYNSGAMTDLGAIAGQNYNSAASAINDSHEIVGYTNTISSVNGSVLSRAFYYTNGTMYNLTFNLAGGPTALLTNALWIDCQGNIAAVGLPAAGTTTAIHSYLPLRQGVARTTCIE